MKCRIALGIHFVLASMVDARRTRGYFKLSGVYTEKVISSFVVGPMGGRSTIRLGLNDPYPNEQHLKLRVYDDLNWSKYQRATVCSEKIRLAIQTHDLTFTFKGDGPMVPKGGKWQAVKTLMIADPKDESAKIDSPRYYYFAVDDCSLEQYMHDQSVPEMYFEINTWNYYGSEKRRKTTQMSYDEGHLLLVHEWSLLLAGILLLWLATNVILKVARKKNRQTVHAAALWITVATGLDFFSTLSEIGHLEMYHYNGYGNYILDCLATQLEALCDSLLVLFLLSIGAGWTLPSDVISSSGSSVHNWIQDISKPLQNSVFNFNATGVAAGSVILFHMLLAQWGRTYNDDFDAYHGYSHLPGKILMIMRVALGFLFLATTMQTRIRARIPSLKQFYAFLSGFGLIWFWGLPVVTFICNWMLPWHWQHATVYFGSATLQIFILFLLAWLVTWQSSSYHQYSHMGSASASSSSSLDTGGFYGNYSGGLGSLEKAKEWKFLGKAKVRFD